VLEKAGYRLVVVQDTRWMDTPRVCWWRLLQTPRTFWVARRLGQAALGHAGAAEHLADGRNLAEGGPLSAMLQEADATGAAFDQRDPFSSASAHRHERHRRGDAHSAGIIRCRLDATAPMWASPAGIPVAIGQKAENMATQVVVCYRREARQNRIPRPRAFGGSFYRAAGGNARRADAFETLRRHRRHP
jgi:hypothetical protein